MNINEFTDLEQWATQQWESADLGDARRNDRAIEIGAKIAANPSASLPEQMESWSALKAAYRLFNEEDVTHNQLSASGIGKLPVAKHALLAARLCYLSKTRLNWTIVSATISRV